MKKKQEPRKEFFPYVMNSDNGTLNCNDPNSGISIMVRIHKGENVRVFPISNWTELDIWNYIRKENIDLPSIYFSHDREVIEHEGQLVAVSDFIQLDETDIIVNKKVRYRTVGDMTCTAAVESNASSDGR